METIKYYSDSGFEKLGNHISLKFTFTARIYFCILIKFGVGVNTTSEICIHTLV